MDPIWLLVLLAVLFPLTHLMLSWSPVRRTLVGRIGEWPFRGIYSGIALTCLGGMILVYRENRSLGPLLWDIPAKVERPLVTALMLVAVVLVLAAFSRPSPAGMAPVPIRAVGLLRITRHPVSMGFACFGLAHLLANPSLGDVVFFGSFLVLGLVGSMHQDQRMLARLGEPYRVFMGQTSIVPFWAILRGRTVPAVKEMPWLPMTVAVVVFLALLLLHERLFGVGVL